MYNISRRPFGTQQNSKRPSSVSRACSRARHLTKSTGVTAPHEAHLQKSQSQEPNPWCSRRSDGQEHFPHDGDCEEVHLRAPSLSWSWMGMPAPKGSTATHLHEQDIRSPSSRRLINAMILILEPLKGHVVHQIGPHPCK